MQLCAPARGPAHPGADLRMCPATEDLFEIHRVSGRGLLCPASSSCVAFVTCLALGQDGRIHRKLIVTHLPICLLSSHSFPSPPCPTQPGFPRYQNLAAPSGAETNSRWNNTGSLCNFPVPGRMSREIS